jgi:hypothetical protein
MIISSSRGDILAWQLCSGIDFVVNLIILESKDIDVILEIDWLSKHNVLIDCVKKSVKLSTPDGKDLEYVVEPVVTSKGAANCVKLNQLDVSRGPKVSVVNEFPDVFSEELSRYAT